MNSQTFFKSKIISTKFVFVKKCVFNFRIISRTCSKNVQIYIINKSEIFDYIELLVVFNNDFLIEMDDHIMLIVAI